MAQIETIGKAYYQFACDYPVYFKLHAEQETQLGEQVASSQPQPYNHPAFELLAHALNRGVADGSIKEAPENLKTMAFSLWAFTHRLLLISTRKEIFLRERMGIDLKLLVENGFQMIRKMLSGN